MLNKFQIQPLLPKTAFSALQFKLLIPSILFSGLLAGTVVLIYINNAATFSDKTRQQTVARSLSVKNLFNRRLQETRSFVELINRNQLVIDGVQAENQIKVLDVIVPVPEKTDLNFLTVYNRKREVFANATNPAVFGKTDKLSTWLYQLPQAGDTASTVTSLDHKIALLSGAKIKSINGSIGATVAGFYLDRKFIDDLAGKSGVELAIFSQGKLITSSLVDIQSGIPTQYQQTSIPLAQFLGETADISLVMLEDNSQSVSEFYRNILTVILIVSAAGIFSIFISLRAAKSVANSHQYLQAEITERQNAEARLQELTQDLEKRVESRTNELSEALQELQQTHVQLVQSEKMSALGELVAGVAHEINNPVNFIYGNLVHATNYTNEILELLSLYQKHYPHPDPEISVRAEEMDLEFLLEDLSKLLASMKVGADRIQKIVLSLRNFSRMDEAEFKEVDIHDGIDSTLMILQNRLKAKPERVEIAVSKQYGKLPKIECYAGQLNQVFMNIISNAIDALEEALIERKSDIQPTITIQTHIKNLECVAIHIADNGIGIPEEIQHKLFNPFFTTKSVGKGTGLGLSISYQIVKDKHGGDLYCISELGKGTEFVIEIPIHQTLV